MKADQIKPGHYYWVLGQGPMFCNMEAGPESEHCVQFFALPFDPTEEPWESYYAAPEDVLREVGAAELVRYRKELAVKGVCKIE